MKGEELGLGPCLCPGGLPGAEATADNSWESNQKEQGPGEMAEAILELTPAAFLVSFSSVQAGDGKWLPGLQAS